MRSQPSRWMLFLTPAARPLELPNQSKQVATKSWRLQSDFSLRVLFRNLINQAKSNGSAIGARPPLAFIAHAEFLTIRKNDLNDSPEISSTLGHSGQRDSNLLTGLERFCRDAKIDQRGWSVPLTDPLRGIALLILGVELQEGMGIGPAPLGNDAFDGDGFAIVRSVSVMRKRERTATPKLSLPRPATRFCSPCPASKFLPALISIYRVWLLGRIPNHLQIFDHQRWNTHLLFEFLFWKPLKTIRPQNEWLGVDLWGHPPLP